MNKNIIIFGSTLMEGKVVKGFLEDLQYTVFIKENGEQFESSEVIDNWPDAVVLFINERINSSVMDIAFISSAFPDVPMILVTENAPPLTENEYGTERIYSILRKPLHLDELDQTLNHLFCGSC